MDGETARMSRAEALSLLGAKVTLLDRQFGVLADDYVTEINIIDEADGEYTTLTIGEGIDAKTLIY